VPQQQRRIRPDDIDLQALRDKPDSFAARQVVCPSLLRSREVVELPVHIRPQVSRHLGVKGPHGIGVETFLGGEHPLHGLDDILPDGGLFGLGRDRRRPTTRIGRRRDDHDENRSGETTVHGSPLRVRSGGSGRPAVARNGVNEERRRLS
jgi:hypothetical protein